MNLFIIVWIKQKEYISVDQVKCIACERLDICTYILNKIEVLKVSFKNSQTMYNTTLDKFYR